VKAVLTSNSGGVLTKGGGVDWIPIEPADHRARQFPVASVTHSVVLARQKVDDNSDFLRRRKATEQINQSCSFRVVQVIKSLQGPLEAGNSLPGINDDVRPGTEMFLNADGRPTETEQISRCPAGQTVADGGSGDREGPAADGRQFNGRYQTRAEGTPTRQISDSNQST